MACLAVLGWKRMGKKSHLFKIHPVQKLCNKIKLIRESWGWGKWTGQKQLLGWIIINKGLFYRDDKSQTQNNEDNSSNVQKHKHSHKETKLRQNKDT